jgi:hypothetical protein
MNSRRIGNTSAGTLRINSLDVHDINRALTAIGMRLDNLQGIGQVPIHPASSGTKTTGAAPSTGSSTTAKAASAAAATTITPAIAPAHPPTPTGLQTELGNTTYRGRDLELTWDDVRNPELYEFTANERFRDYLVEARTNAGAKLREVAVASEKFVYTRDQMVKDGLTDRDFTVRIWARDLDGNLSDTPGKITVSKLVPYLTGQTPAITATSKGIDVDLSALANNPENVDQWKILIDTVNPPVAVARIVPENTKHVFWPKEVNITTAHYVRVIPVDYFGDGTASDVASDSIAPLFESAGGVVRIDDDGGFNIKMSSGIDVVRSIDFLLDAIRGVFLTAYGNSFIPNVSGVLQADGNALGAGGVGTMLVKSTAGIPGYAATSIEAYYSETHKAYVLVYADDDEGTIEIGSKNFNVRTDGVVTLGASTAAVGSNFLLIREGTAPSVNVADACFVYVDNYGVDGTECLMVRNPDGTIIKLKQMDYMADATAGDIVSKFNTFLTYLKNRGLMASA